MASQLIQRFTAMASPKLNSVFSTTILVILLFSVMNANAASSSDDDSSPDMASQIKSVEKLIYKERYKAAIKKLKKALEQDDENADVWNLMGYASRKSGDTDAAANAYSKALELDKDHLGALEYQGELYITLQQLDDAKKNLQRLSELCPSGCEEQETLAAAIAAAK